MENCKITCHFCLTCLSQCQQNCHIFGREFENWIGSNLYFRQKLAFSTKTPTFRVNFAIFHNISNFGVNFAIFDQISNFRPNFAFSTKSRIFGQIHIFIKFRIFNGMYRYMYLRPKSIFSTKCIFDQVYFRPNVLFSYISTIYLRVLAYFAFSDSMPAELLFWCNVNYDNYRTLTLNIARLVPKNVYKCNDKKYIFIWRRKI